MVLKPPVTLPALPTTAISRTKSGLGILPRPLPPTTALSGVPGSRITTLRLLTLVVCLAAEVLGIAGTADRPRRAFLPDFGKKTLARQRLPPQLPERKRFPPGGPTVPRIGKTFL